MYDNALPSTVVEAQRKVKGKKGPRQKHRYVGTQSKSWTVLLALWIRQEPHEKAIDAHALMAVAPYSMSLAPRLY